VIDIPPGVYPGSDRLPVLVAVGDLLSVAGGAVLFALLATLYPSRKATALRPAEGLRYG
jgi:ABC-type lipoprotein release transport system permease subunit